MGIFDFWAAVYSKKEFTDGYAPITDSLFLPAYSVAGRLRSVRFVDIGFEMIEDLLALKLLSG